MTKGDYIICLCILLDRLSGTQHVKELQSYFHTAFAALVSVLFQYLIDVGELIWWMVLVRKDSSAYILGKN